MTTFYPFADARRRRALKPVRAPREEPAANAAPAPPKETEAAPGTKGVEVTLCDGKTTTFAAEGTSGAAVAGALMSEWLRKNPNVNWEADEREKHTLRPPPTTRR